MKAIGYTRVSTEEQSREGVSLDMQATKIRAYCALNDIELVEIVTDAGISAKDIKGRPGFRRALDLVLNGNVDALVVYKLDRAFRSTTDALDTARRLDKRGRSFHSISEKLDTQSAIGRFFFTLTSALAEMERDLIGERTKAAMQQKRSNGERVGAVPYGWDLDANGKTLVENTVEQGAIRLIQSAHANGMNHSAIARCLNVDGVPTKNGRDWTHVQVSRIISGR